MKCVTMRRLETTAAVAILLLLQIVVCDAFTVRVKLQIYERVIFPSHVSPRQIATLFSLIKAILSARKCFSADNRTIVLEIL